MKDQKHCIHQAVNRKMIQEQETEWGILYKKMQKPAITWRDKEQLLGGAPDRKEKSKQVKLGERNETNH